MRYLRNAWYVAALSGELQSGPVPRELVGERMVIFRTEIGETAVIADRCPHRFAPLSLGRVAGESIECGYHGLRFGVSGSCILNPHGDKRIPFRADVPSWPTRERYGFIWFWPGDPARADDALMPYSRLMRIPDTSRSYTAILMSPPITNSSSTTC